jgi:hypothetical protein
MKKIFIVAAVFAFLFFVSQACRNINGINLTETPTPKATYTASSVVSATVTNTATGTMTVTGTGTTTFTPTLTATITITYTYTGTPTPGTDGYYSATTSGIIFEWKVNGSNLDCKVSAATTGWVAVGFNSAGVMEGANIVLGYVTGGNSAVIADMHGVSHTHPLDAIDNVTNKAGTDNGVTTEITFTIPMSNDANSQDFTLVQGNAYWLIMTNGANGDDTLGSGGMPPGRGTVQITLW